MSLLDAVESTAEPAFAAAADGTILAWNRAAEGLLGYSAREAVGCSCYRLLRGRDVFGNVYCAPLCPIRRMAREGQKLHRSVLRLCDAGGRRVECEVSLIVSRDDEASGPVLTHMLVPSRARRRPRSPREPTSRTPLTARQLEVLRLLALGLATEQIADRLGISPTTVRNHVQNILAALDAHSRLRAVSIARGNGWI